MPINNPAREVDLSTTGNDVFVASLIEHSARLGTDPADAMQVLSNFPAIASAIFTMGGTIDNLVTEIRVDAQTNLGSLKAYEYDTRVFLKHLVDLEDSRVKDRERLNNTHIFRSDIGLLSYSNLLPGLHDNGDRYKLEIANLFAPDRNFPEFEVHTYAMTKGDEFGGVVYGQHKDINAWSESISKAAHGISLGEQKNTAMTGNVEIGVVGFGEFFDRFNLYRQAANLTPEQSSEQFLSFLNKMADFRETYHKIINRVDLLLYLEDLFEHGKISEQEKKDIWFHGARGAAGIDQDQLFSLKTHSITGRGFAIHIMNLRTKKVDAFKPPSTLDDFVAVIMREELTIEEFKEYALN